MVVPISKKDKYITVNEKVQLDAEVEQNENVEVWVDFEVTGFYAYINGIKYDGDPIKLERNTFSLEIKTDKEVPQSTTVKVKCNKSSDCELHIHRE